MRYFQRKIILFAATFAFALVYSPLRQFSFGVDVAICASFTVFIFGNAIRKRGFGLFSGEHAKPITELLLIHVFCLAALVTLVRMGMYVTPMLPYWLSTPIGADQGVIGPDGFQVLQTIALFVLGIVELRLLTAKNTKESGATSRRMTLWSKPDLEGERMSSLRLP